MMKTLAIKRIDNFQPHLSYVSTLPDNTQKNETRHWRAEAEAHWHLGPYSSGHHRRRQWQTWLRACVKQTPTAIATQPAHSHFIHTKTGFFQSHLHYWEEGSISFSFFC